MSVIIETTLGDITVDLYTKDRPKTCANFLKLCKIKFYNFSRFHYVERNFLAQTGDPTGTGRGGESIYGKVYGDQAKYYEAEKLPILKHTKLGMLSMVNVGDNMLGSQFFITLGENLDYLDKEHCVFGEVSEGHDTLLKINDSICDEMHVPYQDIRITHTVVLDDPFDDPVGLEVPPKSPEPTKDLTESGRIAADEDIDDLAGKTAEEIEEMLADREAKARATILEMVGDLPSIDAAPPENVLFVCKLNPVTTDEDLMIIFGRFGKINSCEIIRDRQTNNSLQYAFIEYDNPKSCEDAYFKMDNVLIDDRRIHVDFSQSVSKIKWRGKGRGVDFLGGKAFDPNQVQYRKTQKMGKKFDADKKGMRDTERRDKRDEKRPSKFTGHREEARTRRDEHYHYRTTDRSMNRRDDSTRNLRDQSPGNRREYKKDRRSPSNQQRESRDSRRHFSDSHRSRSRTSPSSRHDRGYSNRHVNHSSDGRHSSSKRKQERSPSS